MQIIVVVCGWLHVAWMRLVAAFVLLNLNNDILRPNQGFWFLGFYVREFNVIAAAGALFLLLFFFVDHRKRILNLKAGFFTTLVKHNRVFVPVEHFGILRCLADLQPLLADRWQHHDIQQPDLRSLISKLVDIVSKGFPAKWALGLSFDYFFAAIAVEEVVRITTEHDNFVFGIK